MVTKAVRLQPTDPQRSDSGPDAEDTARIDLPHASSESPTLLDDEVGLSEDGIQLFVRDDARDAEGSTQRKCVRLGGYRDRRCARPIIHPRSPTDPRNPPRPCQMRSGGAIEWCKHARRLAFDGV